MTDSFVPFQPNTSVAAGRDDAILYGAVERDPGGLPRGTIEHITLSDFFNVAAETFQATVHLTSGRGTLRRGSVELEVPADARRHPRRRVRPALPGSPRSPSTRPLLVEGTEAMQALIVGRDITGVGAFA